MSEDKAANQLVEFGEKNKVIISVLNNFKFR